MKTLTLLRHAKSAWDDSVPRDFDRPINARGKRAAQRIGQAIADLGLAFDRTLASPAVRVRETLALVEAGAGRSFDASWDERIYLASATTLLDVVHGIDDDAAAALLIGHNPGLEDLLLMLTPGGSALRDEAEVKYPTATLATLTFDTPRWGGIAAERGTLTRFIRPRDLDPSLGPDD